jgi:hypothetical protein
MAGTLTHVTLAERALDAARLRDGLGREIEHHLHDYRLGAVLVDLPYHENIVLSGLRLAAGRELRWNRWGNRLHAERSSALAHALLERARDAPARALALGALTHLAVDAVFHAEISRRVAAGEGGDGGEDTRHKRIEDEIDLHCHYELIEGPGIGRAYTRRKLLIRPHRGWTDHVRGAVAAVHGVDPGGGRLRRWLLELSLFAVASSVGFAPWVRTLPRDDPGLLESSVALAEEALRRAAANLEAGAATLDGELDREGFLAAVPERSLLDGRSSV